LPLISALKEVVETVPFLGIYQLLSKTWSLQIERKNKLEEKKKRKKASDFNRKRRSGNSSFP